MFCTHMHTQTHACARPRTHGLWTKAALPLQSPRPSLLLHHEPPQAALASVPVCLCRPACPLTPFLSICSADPQPPTDASCECPGS